ncbi:MAG: acetyl-CoA carboxylase biotin carboxyl carrier protein [Candidimonas sp.]|nr:MAG: acetyl-CoA carboxylase biotin carboxyl carrier protein [Candidimonas sp.]
MKRHRVNDDSLSYRDLLEIIKLVEQTDKFTDFRLRCGDVEIVLSRGGAAITTANTALPLPATPVDTTGSHAVQFREAGQAIATPAPSASPTSPPPSLNAPPAERVDAESLAGMVVVKAPMVGIFYRSPEPGAKPFVEVGQAVDAQDTVGILEVMKLMNALPAEAAGVVREILVTDGATVEYDQPLVVIEPTH